MTLREGNVMNPTMRKRALSVAILLVTILGGYASTTRPASTTDVRPRPGYVQTSTGRMVQIDGPDGCHVLTYEEAGKFGYGDPGDGEAWCAR